MRTYRRVRGEIGAVQGRRPGWTDALSDRFLTRCRDRDSAMASGTLLRDQRGVAAVEFGLIAVIMFGMMAGAVDISQRVVFQRDLKRFTASAALAMAACPSGGGDCLARAVNAIKDRMELLFPGGATTELRLGSFSL